jgi:hypothetical protein
MKFVRFFALVMMLMTASTALWAQDDDKPAPYKRPEDSYKKDTVSTEMGETKSFAPKKKFDIGKLLIEPNVQLFFSSNYIQFGLMPSVGYNVWKNLYVGGSLNYNLQYVPDSDLRQHCFSSLFCAGIWWRAFCTLQNLERIFHPSPCGDAGGEIPSSQFYYNGSYDTRGILYLLQSARVII